MMRATKEPVTLAREQSIAKRWLIAATVALAIKVTLYLMVGTDLFDLPLAIAALICCMQTAWHSGRASGLRARDQQR